MGARWHGGRAEGEQVEARWRGGMPYRAVARERARALSALKWDVEGGMGCVIVGLGVCCAGG